MIGDVTAMQERDSNIIAAGSIMMKAGIVSKNTRNPAARTNQNGDIFRERGRMIRDILK